MLPGSGFQVQERLPCTAASSRQSSNRLLQLSLPAWEAVPDSTFHLSDETLCARQWRLIHIVRWIENPVPYQLAHHGNCHLKVQHPVQIKEDYPLLHLAQFQLHVLHAAVCPAQSREFVEHTVTNKHLELYPCNRLAYFQRSFCGSRRHWRSDQSGLAHHASGHQTPRNNRSKPQGTMPSIDRPASSGIHPPTPKKRLTQQRR
ncbi:hypothetical protein SDC9_129254 [bioreactor metagenome]|uniref:Uncharacterized protein n=1 Tax=bioreactor metagenome TaxID=1076179 RepID=A0A645CZA0_9ZZZZ